MHGLYASDRALQNHSCNPNLMVWGYYCSQSDRELPGAVFFTSRDVKQDEELCMDYFGARVRSQKLSQVSAAHFIMHMVDNHPVHLKLEANRARARPDSLRM